MKHSLFLLPLLTLAACQAVAPGTVPPLPATTGALIVRYQDATSEATKTALREAYGATALSLTPQGERWRFAGAVDLADVRARLGADARVQFTQTDGVRRLVLPDGGANPLWAPAFARPLQNLMHLQQAAAPAPAGAFTPNDPEYPRQWFLPRSRFSDVWGNTTAQGVKVAVIDSGVDPEHPDLKTNLLPMLDEVVATGGHDTLKDVNYDQRDGHGHGTHVCGIVGAVTNNGIGVAGSAPNVKILPIKVTSADGEASDTTISKGITDAVDAGAQVINLSIGGTEPSRILLDALNYAFNRNVAVVIAAGNDGGAVNYPAAYNGVLSVGAITPENKVASYSSHGNQLVLVAPGGSVPGTMGAQPIYSTVPTYPCFITLYERKTTSYAGLSGTSMAAPQVTAAVAMLLSREPGLSPAQVRTRLAATTDDAGETGYDEYFGYGVLNVQRALNQGQDDGRTTP